MAVVQRRQRDGSYRGNNNGQTADRTGSLARPSSGRGPIHAAELADSETDWITGGRRRRKEEVCPKDG